MKPTYYIERSGGTWEGRWFCSDEGRYYRKTSCDIAELRSWAVRNGFEPLEVNS